MCFHCPVILKLGTQIYPLVHKKTQPNSCHSNESYIKYLTGKGDIWKLGVIKYVEFEYVVQMETNVYNRAILMTSLINRQRKGKDATRLKHQ